LDEEWVLKQTLEWFEKVGREREVAASPKFLLFLDSSAKFILLAD